MSGLPAVIALLFSGGVGVVNGIITVYLQGQLAGHHARHILDLPGDRLCAF